MSKAWRSGKRAGEKPGTQWSVSSNSCDCFAVVVVWILWLWALAVREFTFFFGVPMVADDIHSTLNFFKVFAPAQLRFCAVDALVSFISDNGCQAFGRAWVRWISKKISCLETSAVQKVSKQFTSPSRRASGDLFSFCYTSLRWRVCSSYSEYDYHRPCFTKRVRMEIASTTAPIQVGWKSEMIKKPKSAITEI